VSLVYPGRFHPRVVCGKTPLYVCSTLYNTEGLRAKGGFHSRHNLFQDVAATAKLAAAMGRVDIENRWRALDNTAASGRTWPGSGVVRDSSNSWTSCASWRDKRDDLRDRGLRFLPTLILTARVTFVPLHKGLRLIGLCIGCSRALPATGRTLFRSTALYRILRHIKERCSVTGMGRLNTAPARFDNTY
jgi:hypothetical protein